MKSICCALFVLLLALPCAAQPGVEGKWSCSSEDANHVKMNWTLTVTRPEGRLKALLEGGAEGAHLQLEQVKFENGTLSAALTMNPPDDVVRFALKLNGDTLAGRFGGGSSGEGSFACKR